MMYSASFMGLVDAQVYSTGGLHVHDNSLKNSYKNFAMFCKHLPGQGKNTMDDCHLKYVTIKTIGY